MAQMVATQEDTGRKVFSELFGSNPMKKKPLGDSQPQAKRGKPESRWVDLDEYLSAIRLLEDAVAHLKDSVKVLSDNHVPKVFACVDKDLYERVPKVNEFARELYTRLGAILHAHRTKMPTEQERNRAKYEKQRDKKKDDDKPQAK